MKVKYNLCLPVNSLKSGFLIIMVMLTSLFLACSSDSEETGDELIEYKKEIVDLTFEGIEMELPLNIDHEANEIVASVLGSVNVTSLVPHFVLSPETTVAPPDGVAYDFSSGMTFQVVAPDKTFENYTVKVNQINNELTAFKLLTKQEAWAFAVREGVIKEVGDRHYEIAVCIHHDDDITDLSTVLETSEGAVVTPDPATIKDYSNPVDYTVSDGEGHERYYVVSVTQMPQQAVTWEESTAFSEVDGIQLFTSHSSFRYNSDGTPMPFSAYAVKIDMTKGFQFVPYYNKEEGNMKVQEMVHDYSVQHGAMPLVGINAGYFGGTSSYSLLINNEELLSSNIPQLTRSGSFYVTRGAFGHDAAMNFSSDWVYTVATGVVYGYPAPSPNVDGETPQPKPSETFPDHGFEYDKVNAIGGGPVLIREGQLIEDYQYELFYDDIIRSIANRTAIGVTANNELVILVVNGRASYSDGIALRDMARIMQETFDCQYALNLDGGGSSTLIINGDVYNQNCIDSGQRNVLTGLLIVKE